MVRAKREHPERRAESPGNPIPGGRVFLGTDGVMAVAVFLGEARRALSPPLNCGQGKSLDALVTIQEDSFQ
jgi:hypothetical protein